MKKRRIVLWLAIVVLSAVILYLAYPLFQIIQYFSGYYPLPAGVAPGCIEKPPTGCSGTHIIKSLIEEPNIKCLLIGENNCNGGVIVIVNSCPEPFALGGLTLENSTRYYTIDPVRLPNGEVFVNYSHYNDANYKPSFNDSITINGTIGNTTVKISYIKTESLC